MLSVPVGFRGIAVPGKPPWKCGDDYNENRIRPNRLPASPFPFLDVRLASSIEDARSFGPEVINIAGNISVFPG
jgi:hypothetical protein